mmetsp:Transcript_670/g.1741  ORF Transcript_670/g.1741 Transcript_670/m.1741 type:complete len:207 (-) Transcript_670:4059-4679(-)
MPRCVSGPSTLKRRRSFARPIETSISSSLRRGLLRLKTSQSVSVRQKAQPHPLGFRASHAPRLPRLDPHPHPRRAPMESVRTLFHHKPFKRDLQMSASKNLVRSSLRPQARASLPGRLLRRPRRLQVRSRRARKKLLLRENGSRQKRSLRSSRRKLRQKLLRPLLPRRLALQLQLHRRGRPRSPQSSPDHQQRARSKGAHRPSPRP